MPDRALSLNSATTKRSPAHHYLPELLSKRPKADAGVAQPGAGAQLCWAPISPGRGVRGHGGAGGRWGGG